MAEAKKRGWQHVDLRDLFRPIVSDRVDVLDREALACLYAALADVDPVMRALTAFQMATACRTSEARRVEWRDLNIDQRRWTRPSHKSKNYRIAKLPLNDEARSALSAARHFHDDESGFVFSRSPDRTFSSYNYQKQKLRRLFSIPPGVNLQFHSIRRSFKQLPLDAGQNAHVGEVALSHTTGKKRRGSAATAYDTADYGPAVADYMAAWNDVLTDCRAESAQILDMPADARERRLKRAMAYLADL